MENQHLKQCAFCGEKYENPNTRSMYCDNACKIKAHRKRHGIAEPDFATSAVAITTHQLPAVTPEPNLTGSPVANPLYVKKEDQVKQIKGQLSSLKVNRLIQEQIHSSALEGNPERKAKWITAGRAVLIIGGSLGIGYLVSSYGNKLVSAFGDKPQPLSRSANRADNSQAVKTMVLAGLIGLCLAAIVAVLTYSNTLKRLQTSKDQALEDSQANMELIDRVVDVGQTLLLQSTNELEVIPSTIKGPTSQSPLPALPQPSTKTSTTASVKTATELRSIHFDLLSVDEPYLSLFGRPERGFAMAVHGAPGQGKSTFVAKLAYSLASHNGSGLYISAEEGFSQSLQSKMEHFETDALLFSNHKTLIGVKEVLSTRDYDVVVLDSIQQLKITPDELMHLRAQHPRTSFIYILQSRKDGDFKGNNSFAHDADIQVRLDKWVPDVIKTRFS